MWGLQIQHKYHAGRSVIPMASYEEAKAAYDLIMAKLGKDSYDLRQKKESTIVEIKVNNEVTAIDTQAIAVVDLHNTQNTLADEWEREVVRQIALRKKAEREFGAE